MLYNKNDVLAIKIAVCNMESVGVSSNVALRRSISWLKDNYERFGEKEYLQKAICNMYAYLELGFPFEDGRMEFEEIFDYLKINEKDFFKEACYIKNRISLTKSCIRGLLGRWNPVLHSMKISDVVEEIFRNISMKKKGEYVYHCGKLLEEAEDKLWENTYKLYVYEEEAMIYCVNRGRYYVFKYEEDGE